MTNEREGASELTLEGTVLGAAGGPRAVPKPPACSAADLGLDPAALSLWAREWSRERFGRPLAPNPDWYVVAGDELAGRVQSVAVFNVLQQV